MKILAPDYYLKFRCIADKCSHSCCKGWEIDVDEEKLAFYMSRPEIAEHINTQPTPHFVLGEEERCPFLNEKGLCELIINYGEDVLCQICRDHPRFRNYFSDRVEIGIGLVCEEAARLILSADTPMTLVEIESDGEETEPDEDDVWLCDIREKLLSENTETGTKARLYEYLVYRHLADALYDGRLDERICFINDSFKEICTLWDRTDGTLEAKIDAVREWSYDVEYDEDELEKRISSYQKI